MIKLSTPFIDGNEHKYVKDCLDTGWISSAGIWSCEVYLLANLQGNPQTKPKSIP